jgi:hypothetical protein
VDRALNRVDPSVQAPLDASAMSAYAANTDKLSGGGLLPVLSVVDSWTSPAPRATGSATAPRPWWSPGDGLHSGAG